MKQLRYYQRDCKDSIGMAWEFYDRIDVKMPTGSGKTATLAEVIRDVQPARVLFLADQDELIQQPRKAIREWTGIIPAIHQGRERPSFRAAVVVGSSQTLARESKKGSGEYPNLEYYPEDHFDYIIIDECHRGTDRDIKVCDYFAKAKVCGITATPFRKNLADLTRWFSYLAYEMDIIDLCDQGFAPPYEPLVLPVEIDIEAIKIKRGGFEGRDFDLDSIDSTISPHYETIAGLIHDNAKGHHGIAFLPLIRSSEAFAAALRGVGIRAVHIDGTSDNRDAILAAYEAGEIDWLTNSSLLSTGVDIPICDCFLNLRLTNSPSWFQQARGRAMRVLPGVIDHLPEKEQVMERKEAIANSAKPKVLLLDLLLQNDRLGAVHVGDDFCKNEYDAKMLFERMKKDRSPEDLAALARRVQEERETALAAALERVAIRSSINTPLTGEQVAALIGAHHILQYVPVQNWERQVPTRQQLDYLAGKGVDPSSIKSKGQANELVTVISDRFRLGFCTLKQVKMIKQFDERKAPEDRVLNPADLSITAASDIIDHEFKNRRRAI